MPRSPRLAMSSFDLDNRPVITGMGCVCPLGHTPAELLEALDQRRSGVIPLSPDQAGGLPIPAAGQVQQAITLPKRLRKSKKLMSREAQFAVTSSLAALHHAGLCPATDTGLGTLDPEFSPERVGVVCGADVIRLPMQDFQAAYAHSLIANDDGTQRFSMERFASHGIFQTFPLAFLKNLPNMLAAHVSIAADARGPNNTLQTRSAASLLAVTEAAGYLQRGAADWMIAGGSSHRLHPFDLVRTAMFEHMAQGDPPPFAPEDLSRPFDRERVGLVRGEGAAVVVLERRQSAIERGQPILGEIAGLGCSMSLAHEPAEAGLIRAIGQALQRAQLPASAIGHVVAEGSGTRPGDATEARAIHQVLPDVPVTTPSGWIGHLEAAAGGMQLVWALLSLQSGRVLPTRNLSAVADDCPIPVVREARSDRPPTCVVCNLTAQGQAVAAVIVGHRA